MIHSKIKGTSDVKTHGDVTPLSIYVKAEGQPNSLFAFTFH